MFFSLCRIDDWKPRIKKKETWQVTKQVELNRVNFTNVVIFNNKDFELKTAATFLLQHIIFLYHYLNKKTAWKFLSMLSILLFLQNGFIKLLRQSLFNIEALVFVSKLVSHNIKVCLHYNFFKPFLVYVVKIMEMAIKSHSNCRSAGQVSYVAVRQWLEILINGFLSKNLGKYWHNVLLNS